MWKKDWESKLKEQREGRGERGEWGWNKGNDKLAAVQSVSQFTLDNNMKKMFKLREIQTNHNWRIRSQTSQSKLKSARLQQAFQNNQNRHNQTKSNNAGKRKSSKKELASSNCFM